MYNRSRNSKISLGVDFDASGVNPTMSVKRTVAERNFCGSTWKSSVYKSYHSLALRLSNSTLRTKNNLINSSSPFVSKTASSQFSVEGCWKEDTRVPSLSLLQKTLCERLLLWEWLSSPVMTWFSQLRSMPASNKKKPVSEVDDLDLVYLSCGSFVDSSVPVFKIFFN